MYTRPPASAHQNVLLPGGPSRKNPVEESIHERVLDPVKVLHAADPLTSLWVPASHATQASPTPASPVYPAAHSQLLSAVLPSADTALAGQAVHPKAVVLLKVPAKHGRHMRHTLHVADPMASL